MDEDFKLKDTILGKELELEYQASLYIHLDSNFPLSFFYAYSEYGFHLEKEGSIRLIKYLLKHGNELLEKLEDEE